MAIVQVPLIGPNYFLGAMVPALWAPATAVNTLINAVNGILSGADTITDVSVGNGTAALPTITFTSDTTTGLYRVSAGILGFTSAGSVVTEFTSTGILSPALDTLSAGALAIGAATATSVVITPATTVTGVLTSTGGILVTGIDKAAAGTITIGAATATGVTITPATTITGVLTSTGGIKVTAIDKTTSGTITIGASTATAVTITPATTITGLTTLTGGATVGAAGVVATTPLTTTPVGTVSIVEYSNGRDITAVLTLTNFIVGALAGSAAALGVGNIVCATPAGQEIEIAYAADSLVFTAAGTAVTGVFGLGSVIATGAVSVLSGTSTFQDRITGTAGTTGASGGAAVSVIKCATAGALTGIAVSATGSIKNMFLNFAGTWNANNTGNLTASGTIVIKYTIM